MLIELGMEIDRKADMVGSLANLSPRGGRLGTAMLGERKFGDCSFSTFPLCLLFMGQIFLDVPCAPNIEPSNTGRSTVNTFSGSFSTLTSAWFS